LRFFAGFCHHFSYNEVKLNHSKFEGVSPAKNVVALSINYKWGSS
jgi:hypothetical protein